MTIMGPEIIILIVVVGILIFGAAKIPKLAKTFGKAKGEFEKGKIEADRELKEFKDEVDSPPKNKEPKSDETSSAPKDNEKKSD
jgi:sec-independent protein translocase protein TatA